MMVRQILNTGRAMPLRRLFNLREYPREVGALYAEGYSVADFLVSSSNRQVFLAFVAHGMQYDWDGAVQTYYRYPSVERLEEAWLSHLRNTKKQSPAVLAKNNTPATADPAKRVIVRLTAPPVQPLQDGPVATIRGVSAEGEQGGWANASQRQAASRPGYLPDADPNGTKPGLPYSSSPAPTGSQDGWQPPSVRLGAPQPLLQPAAPARSASPASPIGYSH
jgi:hypothetical protein